MGNNMENVLKKIQRLRFFVIHYIIEETINAMRLYKTL